MRRRQKHLNQLDRDIRDHIEGETRDNIERGMAPEEARLAALRKFGNIQQVREQTREVWSMVALEQWLQDVRYGLRMLARNPSFATVAIVALALGIGVNTAIFSVINQVLLAPLPYPDAGRLVAFSDSIAPGSGEHFKPGIEGADFAEWQKRASAFEKMAGYDYRDVTLAGARQAAQTRIALLAGDFWEITGAHPALGTLFKPGERQGGIVLSHRLFEQQFRGDPNIVGKIVTLDGEPFTVVGVLTAGFRFFFPQDWRNLGTAEMGAFIAGPPLVRSRPSRLSVVARLEPAVSISSALAELEGIETGVLKSYPDRWFPGIARMKLLPLQERITDTSRPALLMLQVAGVFVLLIACANIANLLLARGAARRHEIAIRAAIGAGAPRMLKQFLTEGLLLALLGGAAGLLVARSALALMLHFGSSSLPRLGDSSIDERVLVFTLMLSLVSALLFGFGPAVSLWRAEPADALKTETRNSSAGVGGLRVRRLLVALQLALALILLAGAGLMLKSFWKMYANPPGFRPANTLVFKVSLSGAPYADRSRQIPYLQELLRRIESLPGVKAYGLANVEGYLLQSKNPSVPNIVSTFQESLVSPGYFGAIGMQLKAGRWLVKSDPAEAALINETMARRVFGRQNPLGRRIDKLGRPVLVVGVVRNLKYSRRDEEPGPEVFRGYARNLWGGNTTIQVAIRMSGEASGIIAAIRNTIGGIDPTQPVYDIQTLERVLAESVAARRLNLFLLGTFAGAALLMAVIGVYGVVAYSVAQRTREIGIRMALGAQRSEVVRMIVGQGVKIALVGIACGMGGALLLTRLIAGQLYDVSPNDPVTFAVIVFVLGATVLAACWGPALKAALLDPLAALRYE